jgi:hypothetical protein
VFQAFSPRVGVRALFVSHVQDNQSVLQFYFDKLINVGDPQEYFRKNQQVGRSEQTITISPNELYRLVTFVSSKLDEVVHTSLPPPHMSCIASRHAAVCVL